MGYVVGIDLGTTIVYGDSGVHDHDLWLARKEGTLWGAPVLLTSASSFEFNAEPVLSPDGTLIAFNCGPLRYFGEAAGVCVVGTDGSGFRQVAAPDGHPNATAASTATYPTFTPDASALVFEARWPIGAVFRQSLAEGSQPERVDVDDDEDFSPCVLPTGRIASRWAEPETDGLVLKVMEADGSAAAVILRDMDIETPLSCGA